MIPKLFFLFVLIQVIAKVNSECAQEEFDRADQAFLILTVFSDSKSYFPTDDQGFDKQCKLYSDEQTVLKHFGKKCLNAFPRQTFGLLLRGVNNELKKYCSKQQLRAEFMVHNKCGAIAKKEVKTCMDKFSKETKQISNANQDDKIPLICCSTYSFNDCIYKKFSSVPQCSPESAKAYTKLAKGYSEDVLQLMCGGTDPNSCDQRSKLLDTLPVKAIKSKSLLLPFIEVVKTI